MKKRGKTRGGWMNNTDKVAELHIWVCVATSWLTGVKQDQKQKRKVHASLAFGLFVIGNEDRRTQNPE